MNALASQLDRPLISIDYPGVGLSHTPTLNQIAGLSLKNAADAKVRVLEQLGHEQVDLMGICIGGVIAANMAVTLGDKARTLLTYSTPGFGTDFIKQQCMPHPEYEGLTNSYARMAIEDDCFTMRHFTHLEIDKSGWIQQLILTRMAVGIGFKGAALGKLDQSLHPSTQWHDLVGERDSLTNAKNHEETAARRNTKVPGSSRATVLQGVDHEWSRERIVLTGRDAELALSR